MATWKNLDTLDSFGKLKGEILQAADTGAFPASAMLFLLPLPVLSRFSSLLFVYSGSPFLRLKIL